MPDDRLVGSENSQDADHCNEVVTADRLQPIRDIQIVSDIQKVDQGRGLAEYRHAADRDVTFRQ